MTTATPIYRAIMLEVERRRVALDLPMEKFSEYAGLPDRYFAKALSVDTPSGRQAQWTTLQVIIDALFPNGFDLIIKPKPGHVITAENLKAKLLQLRATKDPRSQRELMRELSKRGAQKGGHARWKNINARSRARMMRRAAKKRWHTPKIVEIKPISPASDSASRPGRSASAISIGAAPGPATCPPKRSPSST